MRKPKLLLFMLSLILVFGMLPGTAAAAPPVYMGPANQTYIQPVIAKPTPPQNQTQTNIVIDMIGSPTNTIPTSVAGYGIDRYVNSQNAIRDSYLSTARSYENTYNATGSGKAFQRMTNAENAASTAELNGARANYAGKALSAYCITNDVINYTNPTANKHSSLAFVEQTLRGYSITASTLDTAGVKLAKPLAFVSGLLKDAVSSNTFANWANNQDNSVLYYADRTFDSINDGTTYAFSYYLDWFNKTDDNIVVNGRPPYNTGVYKPNIYLYPTKRTDITVSFGMPGLLTRTIPQYDRQWQVTACPDGSLTDRANNAGYDYLFYESGTDPALFTYDSGWIINADTREAQFRRILSGYGFNEREIADFVQFWTKKLTPGVDYIMYPQLTKDIDAAMPITVSPKPENSFRIWFAFKISDGTKAPAAPAVEPMDRNGYTLVEWGGFIVGKH